MTTWIQWTSPELWGAMSSINCQLRARRSQLLSGHQWRARVVNFSQNLSFEKHYLRIHVGAYVGAFCVGPVQSIEFSVLKSGAELLSKPEEGE
jgi:hypothetical protein